MSAPAVLMRQPVPPAPADATFRRWAETGLMWLPERGMGYYPVTEAPYDRAYFEKYRGYAETPRGEAITAARLRMVDELHGDGELVDVGIGCGQFVERRGGRTWGYDVNPEGVRWLHERGLWRDPYKGAVDAVSMWDVLEHIHDPGPLLTNVREYVFVSLPIFRDGEHVIRSRHFRPDEHCWYWTRDGLRRWLATHGFHCVHENDSETRLGREDILSFAFRRLG